MYPKVQNIFKCLHIVQLSQICMISTNKLIVNIAIFPAHENDLTEAHCKLQ